MYTLKSDAVQSFRIESLLAAGPAGEKPPVDPNALRLKPQERHPAGPRVKLEAATQIEATGDVKGLAVDRGRNVVIASGVFPGPRRIVADSEATPRALGSGAAVEVRVKLKNAGQTPVTPSLQLLSNGGPTDRVTAAPPGPGGQAGNGRPVRRRQASGSIAVSRPGHFGGRKGTGTKFASDAVGGVKITARHDGAAKLLVETITAAAPRRCSPTGSASGRRCRRLGQDLGRQFRRPGHRPDQVEHLRPQLLGQGQRTGPRTT